MQKEDFRKELLKKTVEPDKALTLAVNSEMGTFNQLKMYAIKSELNSTVNQVKRMRIANATPYSKMNSTAREKPTTCHICGLSWTSEHRNKCPARGKNAIIVVSKITSRRFTENLRILTPTQNLNRVSIMLKNKIIKLMILIKFRPIMILI